MSGMAQSKGKPRLATAVIGPKTANVPCVDKRVGQPKKCTIFVGVRKHGGRRLCRPQWWYPGAEGGAREGERHRRTRGNEAEEAAEKSRFEKELLSTIEDETLYM
ncbi:unnamed protein product [Prorocentrum cordatum]|uniref:Uncharacterized protein n=1 Tax=Prorocentrum cordatum TaxID=2364126 RepID=A0ABN9VDQ0_9DINO|nr:unnamed protein product [Polarella glacialis]